MSTPSVCCMCLTADRQQFTDRALRCYQAQDYPNRHLLILDSGTVPYIPTWPEGTVENIEICRTSLKVIGMLRNEACSIITPGMTPPEIYCHFDSDDWSAPTRISEQVKLLSESGKQAVGYREMLFWAGSEPCPVCNGGLDDDGDPCGSCANRRWVTGTANGAWIYSNTDPRYIVGTSLCYWRETWKAKPFPECHIGEDRAWIQGLHTLGAPSIRADNGIAMAPPIERPRMIAEIHGSNTCKQYIHTDAVNPDGSPQWRRVPAWDERLRRILESA